MLRALIIFLTGGTIGFFCSHIQYFIFKVTKDLSVIGRQKGYHIHHSMFGVGLYVVPLLFHLTPQQTLFTLAIGSGIILDHTLKEGFLFITRESEDKLTYWFLSRHFLLLMIQITEEELALLDNAIFPHV